MTTATTGHRAAEARALPESKTTMRDAYSRTFVYAFTAVYAVVFSAAAASNYLFYLAPRYDLGNMVQVVWSTAHGHLLAMSAPNGDAMSRLGAHFDPFLALFVPLWWIWSSPVMLLVAQGIAVSSAALPVYWLARKHLGGGKWGAVFAMAYLLYLPTQFNAFTRFGIHAVSFAIPLILYAIWYLDENRLIPFGIFACLAATTKEEVAIAVGCLGLWYAVQRGHRRIGASIFAAGAAVSLINFELIIPHFAPSGALPYAGRYSAIGGTPHGMLRTAFSDPAAFGQQLASGRNLVFVLLVFGPFLFLWALEPLLVIGALPDLAIDLLSSDRGQTEISGHYTAGMVPFVVAASVLGASRLPRMQPVAGTALATICALAAFGPLAFNTMLLRGKERDQGDAMRHARMIIPADAPLSATRSLGGDVSARRVVLVFPAVARADWLLVGPRSPLDQKLAFQHRLGAVRSSRNWQLVFNESGIEVFKRAHAASPIASVE